MMRLTLRIERELQTRGHLRALLAAADVTVAGYRKELRNLKARMARGSSEAG